FEILGSYLTYVANRAGQGFELSRTDGSTFEIVKELCSGTCSSFSPITLTDPSRDQVLAGNTLYFHGTDDTHGAELWKTDGTAAGTVMVADVCPGLCSSAPSYFATNGTRVFFTANDGVHGEEPWITDGTPGGTHMLADLEPGSGGSSPF